MKRHAGELEQARHGDRQFTLEERYCAACGNQADGMQVVASGKATIYTDTSEDKKFQFNGSTRLDHPGQLVVDSDGQVVVSCKKGHRWLTNIKLMPEKKT